MSAHRRGYTLDRALRGVRVGAVVHVNPVTTLIDFWQRVDPHVNARQAQRTIYHALGIPRWADAIDLSVNDRWLDGRIFLRDIRAHGTIDRATGALVVRIRRGKHVVSFRAPRAERHPARAAGVAEWWQQTDVSKLVKGGLTQLGVGVLQGIGAAGGTWVLSRFLEAVGLGKFADALCPVCHMIDQLDALAEQVSQVKVLVEQSIQATEQAHYDSLVEGASQIDGDVSALWDQMTYVANITNDPLRQKQVTADLLDKINTQLISNHDVASILNLLLVPPSPRAYGILQAASAFFGSRKPFFTQTSSKSAQAVFDYYQLLQLRLSILVTNYESTYPERYSPQTIKDLVINKITDNIAAQRALVKPPLPPDTFIDLRTDKNPTMMLWGSPTWVRGDTLEHYCVDGRGVHHRFYVLVANLNCDPPGHDSAKLGAELATETQFKSLLDGWTGKTPLAWLQKEAGLKMTAGLETTKKDQTGFYWVGRTEGSANQTGPVEGPFCKGLCFNDNTLGMYEYIHRYDMQDTSTPSPDAWTRSLGDYDPWNYNANAEIAPQPVEEGKYFWPVGGD